MIFRNVIQKERPPLPGVDRHYVLIYWDERSTSDGQTQWVPIVEVARFAGQLSGEIEELQANETPFQVMSLYGDALPEAIREILDEAAAEGEDASLPPWLTDHLDDPDDALATAREQDVLELDHIHEVSSPYLSGRAG